MQEFDSQLPAADDAVHSSEVVDQVDDALPGATDTPEQVAETDEQKNERVAREAEQKAERRRSGWQRRLDEVTREKHELRRQVDQLIQVQTRQHQPQQAPAQQQGDELARRADEDFADWVERKATAVAERKALERVQAALSERERRESQGRYMQQAEQVREQFEGRMAEFAKATPDWSDVVANNDEVNVPDAAAVLLHTMNEGPQLLYAIGKNPKLATELQRAAEADGRGPPIRQSMVLGRLSASLKSAPARVSNAPPPGTPVGARGGPANKDVKNMTRDEYYAHITRKGKR